MSGDATWSNWFFKYFLTLPDSALPAYNALFAGLDPVDNVARMRSHLYLQWGGQDFFIDAPVRNAFSAADPAGEGQLSTRTRTTSWTRPPRTIGSRGCSASWTCTDRRPLSSGAPSLVSRGGRRAASPTYRWSETLIASSTAGISACAQTR